MSDKLTFRGLLKSLGPGILFAGAAIGGSHLIQSTRAGANYGLELVWVIVLINLFKFPFFEFGNRYVAATGRSIIEGYAILGKWAVITFFGLSFFTSVVTTSAIALVTSALAAHLFGITIPAVYTVILLLVFTVAILLIGSYPLLDTLMKIMVSILGITTIITTIIAFFIAAERGFQALPGYIPPELWDATGVAFLLALMGWMPAPIEVSVWPSLWALERKKQTKYTPNLKEALADFYIGYVGTAIMALFFLGLGAFVMYGTGEIFSDNGVIFSSQLVTLYTRNLGEWVFYIISTVILITMFSTALTVFDAYPRTLQASMSFIFKNKYKSDKTVYTLWLFFLSITSVLIVWLFTSGLKTLMDFATVISFLAAPVFAFINYRVVISKHFPKEAQPKTWLRILSWMGIIFLVGFCILYFYFRLF
jgi:Mn2+/Fe2+ NRAMP family transporter